MKALTTLQRSRIAITLIPLCAVLITLAAISPSIAQTCGWKIVRSPNAALPSNSLGGVSVVAANDVWAVGGSSRGTKVANPLTEHWDGTAWTIVPAPQPPGELTSLNGVSALASNDVWAVGSTQLPKGSLKTFVEHWDGQQWTIVPSPSIDMIGPYEADNFLADVVAIAPNDVWAVGSATTIVAGEALTLHWDGSTWTIVPNPGMNPRFFDANLLGITAVAPNDIWAVGQKTTTAESILIEHWNGSTWSIVATPHYPTNVEFLESVSANNANDIWAVGTFTIPNAEGSPFQNAIMHWDGTSWNIVPVPQPDEWLDILTGVTAISADDAWAVGFIGTGTGQETPEALHWDGTTWSLVPIPSGKLSSFLLGVDHVSSSDVWAVGDNSGGKKTLTEHFTCP